MKFQSYRAWTRPETVVSLHSLRHYTTCAQKNSRNRRLILDLRWQDVTGGRGQLCEVIALIPHLFLNIQEEHMLIWYHMFVPPNHCSLVCHLRNRWKYGASATPANPGLGYMRFHRFSRHLWTKIRDHFPKPWRWKMGIAPFAGHWKWTYKPQHLRYAALDRITDTHTCACAGGRAGTGIPNSMMW